VLYSAKNYDSLARNGPFLLWRKKKRKAFQAKQQLRLLRRQKNATARGATFFSGQAFHGLCWSRSDECGRDVEKCDRALRGAAMKMERMARGTRGTAFLINYKMVIVSRGATFFSGQAFHGLCWSRSDECGRDVEKCDSIVRNGLGRLIHATVSHGVEKEMTTVSNGAIEH
jgi:hypothetical protein